MLVYLSNRTLHSDESQWVTTKNISVSKLHKNNTMPQKEISHNINACYHLWRDGQVKLKPCSVQEYDNTTYIITNRKKMINTIKLKPSSVHEYDNLLKS